MNAVIPQETQALRELVPGGLPGRTTDTSEACPQWASLLSARQNGLPLQASGQLIELYGPLVAARSRVSYAVAHLAQSLDGRIATHSGVSRWLSGEEDLLHTHRMRALADAVLVGSATVLHDDPQLTVRRCAGENPVRVVIDADRRLDGSQKVFTDGAAPTLLLVASDRLGAESHLGQARIVPIVRQAGELDPMAIRDTLCGLGLRWLFVEGGGTTVSRFLRAGALDRLQITIAPVIMGSGRPSIALPEIQDLSRCLRPSIRRVELGVDTMIECVFDA
jgi:diaminohydroxyphosphoribosylaminopyrimidine deaminase/5-amino-6-(5-phosphoribosylamino)uracil reductase